jgi:predicted AAA+ superfamily ATPase
MHLRELISLGQQKVLHYTWYKRESIALQDIRPLHKIITILWGRRVGKTSLLMQFIQEAITQWLCTSEEVIFIDFAEAWNKRIDILELHAFVTTQGISHPVYCFDEIQEIDDFDRQLIVLYNLGLKIFITGSNSKLLSQDLATILRGRTYEIHQEVLSFREFLVFKNQHNVTNKLSLDILLEEYLKRGWYPEVVLTESETVKIGILQSYYELLIYKDLIDRYKIRNTWLLQQLIKSLILSHTKELNINKLFNTYKSQWFEISKNTLYEYLTHIQQTFFVSRLSQVWKKNLFDKRYCIDNGYMQLFSQENNRWQKFESMIFMHLKQKYHHLGFVHDTYEIDFTDSTSYRQVCRELTEENRTRESAFWKSWKNNMLITKKPHSFNHPAITMLSWEEIVLQ